MELIKAQQFAEENRNKLVANIPKKLADKEDRFYDQIKRAKTNPANKLIALYELMSELIKFVGLFSPCKKGCSACCHYNVTISEIEIAHIEKHTKAKRQRLAAKRGFHGEPCPFLKDNACSIYEARPFVCRRHTVLTESNTWCAPSSSNDHMFPLVGFTSVDKAYDLIRAQSESTNLNDIRQVFGNAEVTL